MKPCLVINHQTGIDDCIWSSAQASKGLCGLRLLQLPLWGLGTNAWYQEHLPKFVVCIQALWLDIMNWNEMLIRTPRTFGLKNDELMMMWSLHWILYRLLSSFLVSRLECASFLGSTFLTNSELNQLFSLFLLHDVAIPLITDKSSQHLRNYYFMTSRNV